jgi:hypothetical protein
VKCGRSCVLGQEIVAPQKYRLEAKRLRLEAESATSPTIRHQLLDIAEQYERLAVLVDGMNLPPA